MERSRLRKPTVGMVHEESENYRKVQQLKIPEALYLSTQTLEKNYRDLANRNDASKVALKQLAKDTNLNISKANDCIAALGRYEKARDDLTARTQDHETRVAREKLEKGLDQLRQKFQAIMKALNITTDPGQAPTLFMPEDDADHELLSSLLGAPPGPGYSSERLVQALRQQRHTLQTEIDRLSSQHL